VRAEAVTAASQSAAAQTPSTVYAPSPSVPMGTAGFDMGSLAMQLESSVRQQTIFNALHESSVRQQALANALQRHRDSIANTERSLTMAKTLKKSKQDIEKIEAKLYALCSADLPNDADISRTFVAPPVPTAATHTAVQILSSQVSTVAPVALFGIETHSSANSRDTPPAARPCYRRSPQRNDSLHLTHFAEQDVPGDGNCGFHVMAIIMRLHCPEFPEEQQPGHEQLRATICDLMQRESSSILISTQRNGNASFNIYIEDEMMSEIRKQGIYEDDNEAIAAYCAAMQKLGKTCGVTEFAAFVHMLGDDIRIVYHSTKVVRGDNDSGAPEQFKIARESVRLNPREYHVLQKDGHDGCDGHFVYLVPHSSVHVSDD
jgi:hypothetical protein